MTTPNLESRFGFRKLNAGQIKKVRGLREKFAQFAEEIDVLLADGRNKSLCLTALEEATTWGVKCYVHDGEAES